MYAKKVAFSFFTVPALGKNHSISDTRYSARSPGLRVPDPTQSRKGK